MRAHARIDNCTKELRTTMLRRCRGKPEGNVSRWQGAWKDVACHVAIRVWTDLPTCVLILGS
eukprot:3591763-Pyramimonas_sp.AAC.1